MVQNRVLLEFCCFAIGGGVAATVAALLRRFDSSVAGLAAWCLLLPGKVARADIPADVHEVAFAQWRDGIALGIKSLNVWKQCQGSEVDRISMLELCEATDEHGVQGQRVVFVSWVDVVDLSGRIIHLDELDRLVLPTQQYHKRRSFMADKVIIPSLGMSMIKGPKHDRQAVPDKFKQLQKMWRLALLAQSTAEDTSLVACAKCGVNDASCCRCALCTTVWHSSCAAEVQAEMVEKIIAASGEGACGLFHEDQLPDVFIDTTAARPPMCTLCWAYILQVSIKIDTADSAAATSGLSGTLHVVMFTMLLLLCWCIP